MLDSDSSDSLKLAIDDGIMLKDCYLKIAPFIPTKQPIRCLQCQKFNHTSTFCRSNERCLKCGDMHSTTSCKVTQCKCANSDGDHKASSKGCHKYFHYFNKLNFLAI